MGIKTGIATKIKGDDGSVISSLRVLAKMSGKSRGYIKKEIRNGGFKFDGVTYTIDGLEPQNGASEDLEYQNYLSAKIKDFEYYKYNSKALSNGDKYAIALFSDAHIEESVKKESVLGLNEYNVDIAKKRIELYFVGLSKCLKKDGAKLLYFASLGDTISGFIHEELSQENGLTPPEAIMLAQSLIVSGLKYLRDNNPDVKIIFVGIVGNHSRITKKIQHANGFKMSYEYLMYNNIRDICDAAGLNIDFNIPQSEMCLVEAPDGKRFIFIHGYQIKSMGTGTVCGIYPALNRLALKYSSVFKQDRIMLGHFHSCTSIPNAVVNGSIIGYNSFALTNGFGYEPPAQMYCLYDMNRGEILTRKIYCN